MNKADLVDRIASVADVTKAAAERVLDATLEAIADSLGKGDSVTLIGFGTFDVGKRGARTGRNPQTGQEIQIKARKVPTFRAGKKLKDTVNK